MRYMKINGKMNWRSADRRQCKGFLAFFHMSAVRRKLFSTCPAMSKTTRALLKVWTSYGVYISQLILFATASSYVADFNTRNKLLTQELLKQGYRYHELRKTFSKFYRRYYDLISKFQVGLKSLLRQGFSEPDFYGDLVYKLKRIVGSNNFSAQFIKIISHYKKIG